jgi:hypothetical protein
MWRSFESGQRGDMLLEAMVGVLITAIIGAGLAHVVARVGSAQHDSAVDALVISEVRNVMQTVGVAVCNDASLASTKKGLPSALKTGLTLTASCEAEADGTVGIGGLDFPGKLPPLIKVSASVGGTAGVEMRSAVPPTAAGGS